MRIILEGSIPKFEKRNHLLYIFPKDDGFCVELNLTKETLVVSYIINGHEEEDNFILEDNPDRIIEAIKEANKISDYGVVVLYSEIFRNIN